MFKVLFPLRVYCGQYHAKHKALKTNIVIVSNVMLSCFWLYWVSDRVGHRCEMQCNDNAQFRQST